MPRPIPHLMLKRAGGGGGQKKKDGIGEGKTLIVYWLTNDWKWTKNYCTNRAHHLVLVQGLIPLATLFIELLSLGHRGPTDLLSGQPNGQVRRGEALLRAGDWRRLRGEEHEHSPRPPALLQEKGWNKIQQCYLLCRVGKRLRKQKIQR